MENVLSLRHPRKEMSLEAPGNADLALDPDAKLAHDCRSGSLSAYEQLYSLHGARMKSIAMNMLGNTCDAEDAVQDAFLKIYRGVDRFDGRSAFATWIYRILVNVCYDLARKRRRRKAEVQESELQSRSFERSASGTSDHPLRLTLERSLEQLSERSRSVFLLFEVEGFRHREIAAILNIPEGTSKNLLFEAKKQLQKLLWRSDQSGRYVSET